MTFRKRWIAALAATMLAATAWAQMPMQPGGAQQGAAPMPQSFDQALVVVEIGDLQGLINNAGALAAQVNPMFNAEMLRMQAGQMLGDPQLAGFAPGGGLTLGFFAPNTMIAFAEVGSAQIDTYVQALRTQGRFAAKSGGLIAIAGSQAALDAGLKMAPGAAQALGNEPSPTVKVTAYMPRVMSAYGPMMQMMLGMIAMQGTAAMQQQGADVAAAQQAQQILQIELLGLMQVLNETEVLTLEFAMPMKGFVVEVGVQPKAGTGLADFLSAPVKPADDLMAMLPGQGAVRGSFGMNGQAFSKFGMEIVENALAQMTNVTPADKEKLREVARVALKSGSSGTAFDVVYPDQGLISGATVARFEDGGAAQAVDTMEKTMQQFGAMGMMNVQSQQGISVDTQFTRDVRKHKSVAIHQLRTKVEIDAQADAQAAQGARAILGDGITVDIAAVGDKVVQAVNGVEIEPLIDAVNAGRHPQATPLAVVQTVGPGMQGYMALNAGRLIQALIPMISSQPQFAAQPGLGQTLQAAGASLQEAPPLAMGYAIGTGAGKGTLVVPAPLIATMAQTIAMMQMQAAQQQGGGAPQPVQPGR